MTPYDKVFKAFLSKIQDPLYAELEVYVAMDDLIEIMDAAILNFEYPKVDLKDKDDELELFTNTLGFDEVQILAQMMVLEWMRRELRNVDTLRQTVTTKDYSTFSQANHINALRNAETMESRRIEKLKIKYSMRNGNQPVLQSLGGDGS